VIVHRRLNGGQVSLLISAPLFSGCDAAMSPLLTHLVQGQVPGETGISFPINLFGIALRKGGPRPTSPTLWGLTITVNVVLVVAQLPALLADLSTRVAPELGHRGGRPANGGPCHSHRCLPDRPHWRGSVIPQFGAAKHRSEAAEARARHDSISGICGLGPFVGEEVFGPVLSRRSRRLRGAEAAGRGCGLMLTHLLVAEPILGRAGPSHGDDPPGRS